MDSWEGGRGRGSEGGERRGGISGCPKAFRGTMRNEVEEATVRSVDVGRWRELRTSCLRGREEPAIRESDGFLANTTKPF